LIDGISQKEPEMANGPSRDRGSRKHILDLLEGGDFGAQMAIVLNGTPVHLVDPPLQQPASRKCKADWCEYDAEKYLSRHPVRGWAGSLPSCWWVKGQRTRPTWDLICHVQVSEAPGLLLTEAKAHEGELDWPGKRLSASATVASKANHVQIAHCIQEANSALNNLCDGLFNLNVNSHYQLANRITYAWKLASLGLPIVLLYLGFIGDTYFIADYFQNDAHWQRVMGGYLQGTVSQQFPERVHKLNAGSLQMLVRSLPVAEISTRAKDDGD
jgi:hypothetical protein